MIGYFLSYAIYMLSNILILLIVVEAIMSWFVPQMPYQLQRIYGFINMLTEPVIRPFRRLTQRFAYTSGIDFAPLVAVVAIQFIGRIFMYIVQLILF